MITAISNYVAVPKWNGHAWMPTYVPDGRPMPWPAGFDLDTLPPPLYQLGQWVEFEWSGAVRRGVIEEVSLHGGGYTDLDLTCKGSEVAIATERYARPPYYIVRWNAHGRYVDEHQIVPPAPQKATAP